jgi:hypothetical protein
MRLLQLNLPSFRFLLELELCVSFRLCWERLSFYLLSDLRFGVTISIPLEVGSSL